MAHKHHDEPEPENKQPEPEETTETEKPIFASEAEFRAWVERVNKVVDHYHPILSK